SWDERKHLFFLGTGNYAGKTIADYANEYGIGDWVHERRERYPFLHILNFLSAAYAVMIIGSTEKHYTASKTFQSLLSKKPVFAIFHEESSAAAILEESKAASFLVRFNGRKDSFNLEEQIENK